MKSEYIPEPIPKNKKGAKKMSEKKLFEVPEKQPRTVRVKTLVIIGLFILSHAIAFYAGLRAKDTYEGIINRAVEARMAEAAPAPAEAAQLKANQ